MLRHKSEVLEGYCEAIGRDPATIERTMATPVMVAADQRAARAMLDSLPPERRPHVFAGTPEQAAERLAPYLDGGLHGLHVQQQRLPIARADRASSASSSGSSAGSAPMAARRPFRFLADPGDVRDGASLVAAARRAESIGYSVLVYPDHVVVPFGFVPLLATVAAVTQRLRIAPFVANNDLRHPALLAQDLATLDVLSGGRVEAAIGAGWNRPEYGALGIPFEPVGVRVARLAEAVAVHQGLLRRRTVQLHGRALLGDLPRRDAEAGPAAAPAPVHRRWRTADARRSPDGRPTSSGSRRGR